MEEFPSPNTLHFGKYIFKTIPRHMFTKYNWAKKGVWADAIYQKFMARETKRRFWNKRELI